MGHEQQAAANTADDVRDMRVAPLSPLHLAARRLSDARQKGGRFRTGELVMLLLAHGARAWRASLPETDLRLRVVAPGGSAAVRLRIR